MRLSRRHFFYGSLLAGAVPSVGFGSTPSLKSAGYKSPNEKLNFAAIGSGGQGASNHSAAADTLARPYARSRQPRQDALPAQPSR